MVPSPLNRFAADARRVAAVLVVLVGAAVVMPASADPGASGVARGSEQLPSGSGYQTSGVVMATQGLVARSSKMYITIGPDNPIIGALRYGRFNEPIEDPTSYSAQNRVAWPFDAPACATVPPDEFGLVQYVLSDLTALSVTPDGKLDEVGVLPSVRVNLLAFGSLPATATISLAMTRSGGEVTPWAVHVWAPGSSDIPGCANGTDFYRAMVEGQADVRIHDLEIDGVPVDLGPNCQTERPVDLRLWGEEGYQALRTGNLAQYDGLATGTRIPLDSPYYFEHNGRGLIPDSTGVDIPPFVGCASEGDDLSSIVTAMASGPNNPVRVSQAQPMYSGVDPDDIFKCDAPGFCPAPPTSAPPMPPLPAGEAP